MEQRFDPCVQGQEEKMAVDRPMNRLAKCTSPYLLQHAHNPVDWHPWSQDALARAREEGKPIFLSIGYSACHWCHVMERESFENPDLAEFLNAHFVPVKVDREERPDLDELYMEAVHAMGLRGGWPLSVWLTPDLKPFYGGTYFPPTPRHGMPSFRTVLEKIAEGWSHRREALVAQADQLAEALSTLAGPRPGVGMPGPQAFDRALEQLRRNHDPRWGGFGPAPKFPAHMAIRILLRRGTSRDHAMVRRTLDAMWEGGIYDHLGGGFARYSVDGQWKVPHFEKMLYDNALLGVAYLEGFQALGVARYAEVVQETLDYLMRDLRDATGAYHCAEDADSEGEEGRFYVFTPEEVTAALGPEEAGLFCQVYGITTEGSFEAGRSVLHRFAAPRDLAQGLGLEEQDLEVRLRRMRTRLLGVRNQRVRPGRDDKVLASWNGFALSAFAKAARVLGEVRYLRAAQDCATFILERLWDGQVLLRVWRNGVAHTPGFLEDYAAVAQGLVDLYESDFDIRWLRAAEVLADQIRVRFLDPEEGGCFSTEADQPDLLFRQKSCWDGAIPGGNSLAARGFLHLGRLLGREDLLSAGRSILVAFSSSLEQQPGGCLALLEALDFLEEDMDLVFAGDLVSPEGQALRQAAQKAFLPRAVFSRVESDPSLPLHQGRLGTSCRPQVYPCLRGACGLPIGDVQDLSAWMAGQKRPS